MDTGKYYVKFYGEPERRVYCSNRQLQTAYRVEDITEEGHELD